MAVSRLLAPAAPFLSDWLHRALAGTSVHLARFPESSAAAGIRALEAAMEAVRRLASLARAAREERGLRVRQPLARMQVAVPGGGAGAGAGRAARAAAARGERQGGRRGGLGHRPRAPQGQAELPLARQALRQAHAGGRGRGGAARVRRSSAGWSGARRQRSRWRASRPPSCPRTSWSSATWRATGWWRATGRTWRRWIPRLDETLRREGLAREVVNRVQRLRKEAGYVYTDRIGLWISGDGPRARRRARPRGVHPGRDPRAAAGAGRAGTGTRSGAGGGHRRTRSGGGSATGPGRPQRGRSATQG